MNGKTILIASSDKRGARCLTASLRGAGNRTVTVDSPPGVAALVSARAADLVLLDCAEVAVAEETLGLITAAIPIVAISPCADPVALSRVFCSYEVDHLVCGDPENEDGLAGVDRKQVVTVVEKILRGDFFGIEKYLPGFGVELHCCAVRRADERDSMVQVIQNYLADVGCSRRVAAKVGTLSDELLTNAIYDAPRDRHGRPIYASTNRRTKVRLEVGEDILVRFGCDGERFAISVTDPFGSLSAKRIRKCILRCLIDAEQIEQKQGGAGIGLYTALMSCTQLVFNVEPGQRTEVIALVDLRASRNRGGGHSIQVFSHEDARESDGVPASVIVSDSVRTDLANLFSTHPRPERSGGRVRRRRSTASTWRAPLARRRNPSGSTRPDYEIV